MKKIRVTVICDVEDDVTAEQVADHVVYFAESYNFMVPGLDTVERETAEVVA